MIVAEYGFDGWLAEQSLHSSWRILHVAFAPGVERHAMPPILAGLSYIELWAKVGGAHWLLDSPSCWRWRALSSLPPGPAGGRGRFTPQMSPSGNGCRFHLSPIPTTFPLLYCSKPLEFVRRSRMIGDPFATSLMS